MSPRGDHPLTIFGAVMLELMISRGIRAYTELSALLREHGYDFKSARMSNWAYGWHSVDSRFPSAFAEVLRLDPAERAKLAEAFAYGQHEPITARYLDEGEA